ncbi:Ubiquitin-conjugating enzyme E2 4 [Paramecium bursaria]
MENRAYKELNDLVKEPIPNSTISLEGGSVSHWMITIQGPAESPYAGGIFKLEAKLANNYPFKAPEIHFITPIFHPNVSQQGEICKQMLGLDHWAPYNNMRGLIEKIQSMLIFPNPDDGSNPEAQHLYKQDIEQFNHRAKAEIQKFAK